MGRVTAACALAVVLCGCSVVGDSDPDVPKSATAYARDAGVEVWDLRGTPSAQAFGATGDDLTPTYSTDEGRVVRLLLPGGRSLDVRDATPVSFACFGEDEPACWQFGVTTSSDPGTGLSILDDCLTTLRLPETIRTRHEIDVALAQEAQQEHDTGDPLVRSPTTSFRGVRLGRLSVGCSARYDPDADLSRVDVSGTWYG